jgi:hypothetical protein
MTSRQPLIPGESEEALQAHLEHWNALYPEVETDELLSDLVREAAFSQWLLFRSQRQYDFTLAILHKTQIDDWTPAQNHTFQLRERYLNSAQRRLNRNRTDILQYQRNLRSQAHETRTATDYAAVQEAKNKAKTQTAPRPFRKHNHTVLQLVHVCRKNGQTETTFTPANDHLLDHIANFRFETTLVERSIRFEDHQVPPEYEPFAARAARLKDLDYDARIIIPITIRSLRIAVEREKEFGGHLREWPDLRAEDEHIIQMKEQELCPPKE